MQSQRLTALEVMTNTFTGLLGSWLISLYFISQDHTAVQTATVITAACTVWSILRGYVIRRLFNRIGAKHVNKSPASN